MAKQNSSNLNSGLWLLIGKIHHKRILVRQRELIPYNIPTRQLHILGIIHDLGPRATIAEIAKKVERKVDVVSRHCQHGKRWTYKENQRQSKRGF